ncbi:DNA-binding protein WhiA [Fenollaria sporofastidiosus]|uniref:DNA-binding protein WhiA n=1 Tax=Fenollaria sporofastidiosus TaxID=2811778 RepID=UPI001C004D71|nr:DNA-binding protein WhiA [Fenollaria sporofastidiosus]
MSFSQKAKDEAAKLAIFNDNSSLAELMAYVRYVSSISFISGKVAVSFRVQKAALARRIFTIIRMIYNTDLDVDISKMTQLKKMNIYTIVLSDTDIVMQMFKDTRLEGFLDVNKVPSMVRDNDEMRRSYLRAAFLAVGSIANPERGYHLEMLFESEFEANEVKELMNVYGLGAKYVRRKENYITYLKGAEAISDFLTVIGAMRAVLSFENIRVVKDVRNNANRRTNCETANIQKTVDASTRQVADIEYIDERLGLENLQGDLRELALLRLDNRDASLAELGRLMSPELGKSGVNHRLKKLAEMAENLRINEEN